MWLELVSYNTQEVEMLSQDIRTKRVIEIVEDSRSTSELFVGFRDRKQIAGADLDDLADLIQIDPSSPEPGKSHLLTVLSRYEVVPDSKSTLAQLFYLGSEAGLQEYPLRVALLAAESCSLNQFDCPHLLFAHTPLYLPCVNNVHKYRRLCIGVLPSNNGHNKIAVERVKNGRVLCGAASIAFGEPNRINP
ncbi:MAG: hypothetical protein ABIT47_03115 [Candidatus Paceibacterota bacterium]